MVLKALAGKHSSSWLASCHLHLNHSPLYLFYLLSVSPYLFFWCSNSQSDASLCFPAICSFQHVIMVECNVMQMLLIEQGVSFPTLYLSLFLISFTCSFFTCLFFLVYWFVTAFRLRPLRLHLRVGPSGFLGNVHTYLNTLKALF